MTETQKKAMNNWCAWYCERQNSLNQLSIEELTSDDPGYEQELFEAFGCNYKPFPNVD